MSERVVIHTFLWIVFTVLIALVIPFTLLLLVFPPEMER